MAKNKTVGRKHVLSSEREARSTKENQQIIESAYQQNPAWQFGLIDMEHEEWGWQNVAQSKPLEILTKIQDYETRKWHEIHSDKKRDHFVGIDKLSSQARKRLEELKLDDHDRLFRLRFEGKLRIWGILHGHVFKVLWLDPEHTVCSSSR